MGGDREALSRALEDAVAQAGGTATATRRPRRRRAGSQVALVEDSSLPPLPGRRTTRQRWTDELQALPGGRAWKLAWYAVREAAGFVVLLWLAVIVGAFADETVDLATVTLVVVTIRVAIVAARMAVVELARQ